MKSVVVDRLRLINILKSARQTQMQIDSDNVQDWVTSKRQELERLQQAVNTCLEEHGLFEGVEDAVMRLRQTQVLPEYLAETTEANMAHALTAISTAAEKFKAYQNTKPPKPTHTKYDSVIRMCLASEAKTITLTHEEAEKYLNEELNSNGQPEQD